MSVVGESGSAPQSPWSTEPAALEDQLEANLEVGLTSVEAESRLEKWGANHLRRHRPRNAWLILLDQIRSLVVALLLAAAVAAAIFGEWLEAAAVTAVVIINTAIGFAMELSARRSMEALRSIGRTKAVVIRDGQPTTVSAEELVPGDVVIFEAGDVVSADIRIVEASNLEANESVFTGESLPATKSVEAVEADTVVADRTSMLFKGTSVSHGSAHGLVVATGMQTELGKISSLVASVEETKTPLEVHLNALSKKLVWLCLGLAALVAVATLLQGRPLLIVLEMSVALAVATIPEGLPVVATLALSRGMFRMARRNAVVKNLAAVETLGSTSVICTDKTGTLTENHLTVERVESVVAPRRALEIGALCNDASLAGDGVGDALEIALLEAAERDELDRDDLLKRHPRVRLEAFATSTMKMATVHETPDDDQNFRFAVKGAPEAILDVSSRIAVADGEPRPLSKADRETWLKLNDEMASEGLRIIAVAEKSGDADDEPYEDLVFVGLVAFSDPIRADVKPSIEACRSAGIDVIMITGDQPSTAYRIGRDAGIEEGEVVHGRDIDDTGAERLLRAHIFARVDPAQKLDLIQLHQDAGAVVAMTGDGVNDAPALRKADIGIAMGRRGTDVARQAADMVLRDDSFPTIVAAVRQGRVIFDNVRLFVVYLLSCNVSELLVIAAATMIFPSTALPITALQILYLNLVTDVFPALALGFGEGDDAVMRRPPRKLSEPVLTRFHWGKIAGYGALIATTTLTTFGVALRVYDLGIDQAITIAFCTVAFAQLFHVFNMVSPGAPLFRNQIAANRYVWGAIALCTFLILGPFALETTSEILSLTTLGPTGWGLVAVGSTAPLIVGTIVRVIRRLVRSGSISSG